MAEIRRKISPYDLTAADNPGAIISYPLLKSTNYDDWACSFKTALLSRKKFGFLDGTIPKPPPESADYDDWVSINALLVSWIKMTIDPELRMSISHRDVARDMWEHLRKRFSVANGAKNQKMKSELANCKQNGMTVEAYFGKLTKIWENINNYRPLRVCECGGCVCDLGSKQETDREDDMVQQFLYGLDEKLFHTIRSSISSRNPLPRLEEAYNLVCQEEDMQINNKISEEQPQVSVFAVQAKQKYRNDDKEKMSQCRHCHRFGHASDSCFLVVGYPEWWGNRPRVQPQNNPSSGRGRSFQNNNQQRTWFANAVSTPSYEKANRIITDVDRDAIAGLNDEQWCGVMKLLNTTRLNSATQSKSNNSSEALTGMNFLSSWILDTGASHHMTGKLSCLTNIRAIAPVLVVLADGRERVAVTEGTVHLGPHIILKSVFYVEEMQSDLISVGQMMDENHCVVQLADHFLVIQDRTTRMVTGVGKREGGSFWFRSSESVAKVSTKVAGSYDLWHKRMGHPSAKVVSLISGVELDNDFLNTTCDTCIHAKQT